MKMKVSTRIIFTIYLIVVILICAFLLASMFNLVQSDHLILSIKTMLSGATEYIALYTCIFVVMIVVGFILMFFVIRSNKPKTAVLSSFDGGKIVISVNAIEQLAKKYIKEFDYVKEEKISIFVKKNNTTEINVKVQVYPEINIPVISEKLRAGLVDYVRTHSGIVVSDAKVVITSVNETIQVAKNDGGYR